MHARRRRKTGDESLIYLCSFPAQAKNLFAAAHKFSPALLPFKGVLPIWRHHPFSRQPEQRYNTLDFASKIVCQKGYPSLDSPSFSAQPVYTHRISACDSKLPENIKSPDISSSQWMKYQGFLSRGVALQRERTRYTQNGTTNITIVIPLVVPFLDQISRDNRNQPAKLYRLFPAP